MTIVKSQLLKAMGKRQMQLNEQDVTDCVNLIIDTMTDRLMKGDRVEIRGFGTFTLHYRRPRRAHNPRTGVKVLTAPKYMPHFKPGKEMRERIKASRAYCEIKADDGY